MRCRLVLLISSARIQNDVYSFCCLSIAVALYTHWAYNSNTFTAWMGPPLSDLFVHSRMAGGERGRGGEGRSIPNTIRLIQSVTLLCARRTYAPYGWSEMDANSLTHTLTPAEHARIRGTCLGRLCAFPYT